MIMNSGWNLKKIMWSRENSYLSGNPCGMHTQIRRNKLTNKKQYPEKKERQPYFLSSEICTKIKHIYSRVLEVCRAKCALRTQYLNLSLNSLPGFLTPEAMERIQSSRLIFSYLFEVIFILQIFFTSVVHPRHAGLKCDMTRCIEMH